MIDEKEKEIECILESLNDATANLYCVSDLVNAYVAHEFGEDQSHTLNTIIDKFIEPLHGIREKLESLSNRQRLKPAFHAISLMISREMRKNRLRAETSLR